MECLIEECVHISQTRGLCPSHYAVLSKKVLRKEITWLQLEGFGMAIPARKIGKNLAEKHLEKVMRKLNRAE